MSNQTDYILFVCGLFFLLSGLIIRMAGRSLKQEPQWQWLERFAFTHALGLWLAVPAVNPGSSPVFRVCASAVSAISFFFLAEFGRRALNFVSARNKLPSYIPFLLLPVAAAGLPAGIKGVDASFRLSVGLYACVLSAFAMAACSRHRSSPIGRGWMMFGGGAFLLYGTGFGVAMPLASLPVFGRHSGIAGAAQLFNMCCGLAIALSVYAITHPPSSEGVRRLLLPLALIPPLLFGWWGTTWRSNRIIDDLRQRLLLQTAELADTLDQEPGKRLTFTASDIDEPLYSRWCKLFDSYSRAITNPRISLMTLREGQLVYGPTGGYADGSRPGPGTVYPGDTTEALEALKSGGPRGASVFPLSPDIRECVAVVFAPVRDFGTTRTPMLVMVEKNIDNWRGMVFNKRLEFIFSVLILVGIIIPGFYLLEHRHESPSKHYGRRRYPEVALVAAFGICFTLILSWMLRENEMIARNQLFIQLAEAQSARLQSQLVQIQDLKLLTMSRFFESSEYVSFQEFNSFAMPLLKKFNAHGIAAAVLTSPGNLPALKAEMSREGYPGFRIYELGVDGNTRTVPRRNEYLPITRIVPETTNRDAIGFDLLSEPRRRQAIEEARRTGLPIATTPCLTVNDRQRVIFAYAPIFTSPPRHELKRVIVIAINSDEVILASMRSSRKNELNIHLLMQTPDTAPVYINSYPQGLKYNPQTEDFCFRHSSLSCTFPVFALGHAYTAVISAGPGFLAAHRLKIAGPTLSSGLLVTLLITVLVWNLASRRITLEQLVGKRTLELVEIQQKRRNELERLVNERTAELRNSENLLSATLCSIGDGVIRTDRDGLVTGLNAVAEKLTGWTTVEAAGKPVAEIFSLTDASGGGTMESPAEIALRENKTVYLAESAVMTNRHGQQIIIADSAAPIRDSDNRLLGIVLVFRDITVRKQLEEKLRQSQKMDAIGQLAGGVAHDFNNMLAGIMGAADILLRRLPPDNQEHRRMLDIIVNAADKAAGLTRKLLDFSRKGKVESLPVDIHALLNNVVGILERSIDPKINIVVNPQAPRANVIGDPAQIQNAFLNLGINSRDAMPDGGELSFATSGIMLSNEDCRFFGEDVEPGEYLEIAVADNGCGIPREVQKKIFEPFFTTKEVGHGTGLGLSAVYGMVREHKGTIHVYSEPGRGTTFKIYLPLSTKESETPEEVRPAADFRLREYGLVIVADDEPLVRETAAAILKELGCRVMTAADGAEALELVKSTAGDAKLVILDMIMPGMNGREAFYRIREIAPDLPVLFSSGFACNQNPDEFQNQPGVYGFVSKPYRISVLDAALSRVFRST